VCQAGAGSVKMGGQTVKDSGYSKVVQDVLESAIQQSLVNTASASSSVARESSCVCHICSTVLKNPVCLRNHIRGAHLAIKSHHCNVCGESFQWPTQLMRHKNRDHGADGNQLLMFR